MKVTIESRSEARLMLTLMRQLEEQESILLYDPTMEAMYAALEKYNMTPEQINVMNEVEELSPRAKVAFATLIGIDAEYAAFAFG